MNPPLESAPVAEHPEVEGNIKTINAELQGVLKQLQTVPRPATLNFQGLQKALAELAVHPNLNTEPVQKRLQPLQVLFRTMELLPTPWNRENLQKFTAGPSTVNNLEEFSKAAIFTISRYLERPLVVPALGTTPEVQAKVKAELVRVQAALAKLKAQVDAVQKSAKAHTEEQLKTSREEAAKAMVGLAGVDKTRFEAVVKNLALTLNDKSTVAEITTALEGLGKQSENITKALTDLAREVAPNTTYVAPPGVDRAISTIAQAVNRAPEWARPWIASFVENFDSSFLPQFLRSMVEGPVRQLANELAFNEARQAFLKTNGEAAVSQITPQVQKNFMQDMNTWRANNRLPAEAKPTIQSCLPGTPRLQAQAKLKEEGDKKNATDTPEAKKAAEDAKAAKDEADKKAAAEANLKVGSPEAIKMRAELLRKELVNLTGILTDPELGEAVQKLAQPLLKQVPDLLAIADQSGTLTETQLRSLVTADSRMYELGRAGGPALQKRLQPARMAIIRLAAQSEVVQRMVKQRRNPEPGITESPLNWGLSQLQSGWRWVSRAWSNTPALEDSLNPLVDEIVKQNEAEAKSKEQVVKKDGVEKEGKEKGAKLAEVTEKQVLEALQKEVTSLAEGDHTSVNFDLAGIPCRLAANVLSIGTRRITITTNSMLAGSPSPQKFIKEGGNLFLQMSVGPRQSLNLSALAHNIIELNAGRQVQLPPVTVPAIGAVTATMSAGAVGSAP